jgi:hypothetical protein
MGKKIKSKTSVNVEAVRKEVSKMVKETQNNTPSSPNPLARSHAELEPGTCTRQSPLEQGMGSAKYKQMIHGHNDRNKHILDRLPFTFPKKRVVRSHRSNVPLECSECGYESFGSEHAYMKVCSGCKQFTKVIDLETQDRGEDENPVPGFLATASDILRMKKEYLDKKGQ